MKTFFYYGLLLWISVFNLQAQQKIALQTATASQKLTLVKKANAELTFLNSISTIELTQKSIHGQSFIELSSQGLYKSNQIGNPDLPSLNKLIEIPIGAEIEIVLADYDEEVIDLNTSYSDLIQPVQAAYSKSQSPSDIPFTQNQSIYQSNQFFGSQTVNVEYIGESRGLRIGRLTVNPFSYNPQTNTLKIKNNLVFTVKFKNADLASTQARKQQFYSPAFASLQSKIISIDNPITRDQIVDYGPVKYIIVSPRSFETTLQPFVEWKTLKGFNVIEAYTDVIGSTTAAIKTYLQNQYNSPSDGVAPSYVLFVGDIAQIPAFNSSNSGDGGTDHITDLYYCEYTGDYIPELYYGRFSATTIAELTPQIDKTIEYEKYLMADPSFLNEAVLVAGVDGSNAPSFGNGQIYYGINEYFNAAHGYTDVHTYLYGSGSPITSDEDTASYFIKLNVSEGAGFVNYTAHCDWDGWSDPSFNVNDVAGLTNSGQYSLMVGNCCRSNRFNAAEACFGERMMRANNAGVIGYIGGSDYSYWYEDFYWGVGVSTLDITAGNANLHNYANTNLGAYDGAFHEHGEAEANWHVTSGQMMYFGNIAVTEGGTGFVEYYWEIYHLMGDPSLMPYFTTPSALTTSYASSVPVGTNSLLVQTNAPGCYVAISNDGILLDAQLADVNGNITLNFDAFSSTGTAKVVATKQNMAPFIGTLQIIVGTEPPIAQFVGTPTTIYENQSVQFTDQSSNGATSWSWNFGDGQTATNQHPSHTYTTAGSYTVSLTASNTNGNDIEEKLNYITVNAITQVPDVDFTANVTSILAGETVNFTDLSTLLPNEWLWDFGDGGTSTTQHPSHTYNAEGFYTVTLTATNTIGAGVETKTNYIEVTMEPYCDASSAGTNYENITNVTFGTINNSSASSGYADYTNLSTDINAGSSYTFTVTYDGTYIADRVYVWIDFNQNQIFESNEKFDVASGRGNNSPYDYSIAIPSNAICGTTKMRVRLNDSNSGSNDTPCGESNWGEVEDYNVFIVNLPVADFNITQTDNQVHFTNNSSNASIYQWNFGDGNTSNLPNPTHSYSSDGNYTVELTVSNDCGSTSVNHTVNITSLGLSQVVNGIGIYPIPASEKMNIKYTSNDYSYKIISIDGREVISGKSNNSVQIIDISDLTPGIYQVQIQTSNEILSRSVVIE